MQFLGVVNGWTPQGGIVKVHENPLRKCRQTLHNTDFKVIYRSKHILAGHQGSIQNTNHPQVLVKNDIFNFTGKKGDHWFGQLYLILLILERKFKFRDIVPHDSSVAWNRLLHKSYTTIVL